MNSPSFEAADLGQPVILAAGQLPSPNLSLSLSISPFMISKQCFPECRSCLLLPLCGVIKCARRGTVFEQEPQACH